MGPSQERSRRERRRVLIAALIYVPSLLVAAAVDDGPELFVPALVAGLAMIFFAIASVRHGDELQRLVHLEALAFAFIACAVGSFILALLAPSAGDPLPSGLRWKHLWIVLSSLWCVGLAAAHWRHR